MAALCIGLGLVAADAADVSAFGTAGDGAADDTAAFSRALAALPETGGALTVPAGVYRLGDLTIPETVTLRLAPGARLQMTDEARLVLDGGLEAPLAHVFDGAVTGSAKVMSVFPQWFGATGDGTSDDAVALQRAFDLAQTAVGRTAFIPAGTYLFRSNLSIRCNVTCRGTLVKRIEIDPSKGRMDPYTFLVGHRPTRNPIITVAEDDSPIELDPQPFMGIQEGDFRVPVFMDVPVKKAPDEKIALSEGGTLRFYSSDFFTSRKNNRGDEWYDRNDMCQIISPRGDVYPEFAFDYTEPDEAPAWQAEKTYAKGDYATSGGKLFKATWPSGPGTGYTHRTFGEIEVGPHDPAETGVYRFAYEDGTEDRLTLWREVRTAVWYHPPQTPITIDGLRIEVYGDAPGTDYLRVTNSSTMGIRRSNVTLNNLSLTSRDHRLTLSAMCGISSCCNVTFNNCLVSGATYHGLGYNLLHSNCANITYNNCISINCRDAIAGRHGKNILIDGGHYNRIDDHYGRNYTIRNAELHGVSTYVPGYCTPEADLANWSFRPSGAFAFGGCNITIEGCRVRNCSTLFSGRGDTADLYGTIIIRDVSIESDRDVSVFYHSFSDTFDFAHRVRTPSQLVIDNVTLNSPHRLSLTVEGSEESPYGNVELRNCRTIGTVRGRDGTLVIRNCLLRDSTIETNGAQVVSFDGCEFAGELTVDQAAVGFARGSLRLQDAVVPFPLEWTNPDIYHE